jgi:hypothetical protein
MQRSLESNGADRSEPFVRRLLGLQDGVCFACKRRFGGFTFTLNVRFYLYFKRHESADRLFNYPHMLLLPIRPANPTVTL